MIGLVSVAMGFFLAMNVVRADGSCLRSVQLHTDMTCQAVADLCKTSADVLWRINGFNDQASMCGKPLPAATTVCCETKDGGELEKGSPRGCNDFCPTNIDPVCGSDGVQYPNQCVCEWASCQNQLGKFKCEKRDSCRVPETFLCLECLKLCSPFYDPVCGTDGQTYYNGCFFSMERCCRGKPDLAFAGECPKKGSPSLQTCDPTPCSDLKNPVCGSDGVTYSTECDLERESCRSPSKQLELVGDGPCRPGRCVNTCPKIVAPVCGTDNVTYANSCFLALNACRFPNRVIVMKGTGPCEPVRSEQTLDILLGALIGGALGFPVGAALGAGATDIISAGSALPNRNGCFSTKGRKCIFPFIYQDKVYSRCTRDGGRSESWCATAVNGKLAVVQRDNCGIGCGVGKDL